MSLSLKKILIFIFACSFGNSALACDLCALYSAVDEHQIHAGEFKLSLAEQYTYFATTQENGRYLADQPAEHLSSFITQVVGSYGLVDRLSLELHLPVISRRYQRLEEGALENGSVEGLGDAVLLLRGTPWIYSQDDLTANLDLLVGVKFPTGDSDELEEQHEHESDDHAEMRHAGHEHEHEEQPSSAIHGHDLALGSGSVDVPLGAELFVQNGRSFAHGALQYSIRTEGDHQYEFADDFLWSAALGYYLSLSDDSRTALRVNLSGEIKDKDKIDGESEPDTAINSKFIGPELSYSAERVALKLGLDLPIDIANSGTQLVADYRLRAGFTYTF